MKAFSRRQVLTMLAFFICILLISNQMTDGVQLAYEEISPTNGGNGGPDVIMMHGLMSWKKEMKPLATAIANNTGRKVFILDSRNHGDSPRTEKMSISSMADDLDEFLMNHNINKAVLFGHSLGGKAAMLFATKQPSKVEKIIIEDIGVRNVSRRLFDRIIGEHKFVYNTFSTLEVPESEEDGQNYVSRLLWPYMKKHRGLSFDLLPIERDGNIYRPVSNLEKVLQMTPDDVNMEMCGVYTGDALFIDGTKSHFNLRSDSLILEYFPQAKLIPVEGGFHLLHHQFPEDFAQNVSDFINDKSER